MGKPKHKKDTSDDVDQETTKKISGRKLYRMYKKEAFEKKLLKQEQKEKESKTAKPDDNHGVGITYTVSIAVPGSILRTRKSDVLQTSLAGQIARAAAMYKVDEIVVFDDAGTTGFTVADDDLTEEERMNNSEYKDECLKMAKILQYLECPQYLRKALYPIEGLLDKAGVLTPLDTDHHFREKDHVSYREGVVLNKSAKRGHSFAYVGLKAEVLIDREIQAGVRVTVKLNSYNDNDKKLKGVVVSPSCPRTQIGLYWGYNVRLAHSLGSVLTECPYEDGYDLLVGTSDKGISYHDYEFPAFKHLIIVFGGLNGLESSLEADEELKFDGIEDLFNAYLNTCPSQGTKVIRTEEAVLMTLTALSPKWLAKSNTN